MSSFGETSIGVSHRVVGLVRILNVYHAAALYPRLTFQVGVSLHDNAKELFAPERPIEKFEMRDLHGEIRLEEVSRAIGSLSWIGPRRFVRSAPYPSENQIEVACELDWLRLERLEEYRAGGEATLWFALWPSLVDGKGHLDCEVPPFRAAIPRDHWLRLIGGLTDTRRSLLEIVQPATDSPEFAAAIGHLQEAVSRINRGDYDEAVAGCRRAIESMCSALNVPSKPSALETALGSVCDAKRAKAYGGIVGRLKELGNFTIHRSEAPGRYTRAEALFVVGATQSAAGLLSALLRERTKA